MEIKVEEYDDYWECGDGCCTNYDTVSVFHYNGNTYEYRSYDSENNLKTFLEDVLGLTFKYEYGGNDVE